MIVVTTAYRLNILGFYTDNTAEASGNWGLLDQAAALDWVSRNIDSFGGSAQNVTVFGQGAGAVSVGLHAVSPVSRNKFQRAIGMSGNAMQRDAAVSTDAASAALDTLADRFNCFRNTLTGCLRNVGAEELVRDGGSVAHWGPVVDGPALANASGGHEPFLPDEPATLMEDGRFVAVPYVVGYDRMEGAFDAFDRLQDAAAAVTGIDRDQFEGLVREAVEVDAVEAQAAADDAAAANCTVNVDFVVDTVMMRYTRRADDPDTLRRGYVTMAANKAYGASAHRAAALWARYNATYAYRYEYKLRAAKALPATAEWMDAPHGAELPLVWGMPYWPSAGAAAVDWTAADRRMADVLMSLWTNFAKHGDPAYRMPTVRWEEYRQHDPRLMVLDKNPNMSLPDQEPEFWNEYYPKVLAVATQCCENFTVESAADVGAARPPFALLALAIVVVGSSPLLAR